MFFCELSHIQLEVFFPLFSSCFAFTQALSYTHNHRWVNEPLWVPPGGRHVVWHHFDFFFILYIILGKSHAAVLCSTGCYQHRVIDLCVLISLQSVMGGRRVIVRGLTCLSAIFIVGLKPPNFILQSIHDWSDLTLWIENWCAYMFSVCGRVIDWFLISWVGLYSVTGF